MSPGPYLLDCNMLIKFFSKMQETVELLVSLKKHAPLFTSLLSVVEIIGWSDSAI